MKKDKLIKNLKELFDINQLFNSIIIDAKNQKDGLEVSRELLRYIFCLNKSDLDDNCQNCIRIKENKILDIIKIGNGVEAIDKKEIQEMMKKMSLTPIEKNGIKFYIIANAENLKPTAANSLLKFLEEPPMNTFAILLSNNRSEILNTIKSRSKIFVIENSIIDSKENSFEKIIKSNNKEIYLLSTQKFKSMPIEELLEQIETGYKRVILKDYIKFADLTLNLINDLKFGKNNKLSIEYYFIKIAEEL